MDYTLSKHAEDAIRERGIRLAWLEETSVNPARTESDSDDELLAHALRPIAEFDFRVLRAIYNHIRTPPHVITVYFDRTMKGRLCE